MGDARQAVTAAAESRRPFARLILGCLALTGLLVVSGGYAWLAGTLQWASFGIKWIPMAPSTALALGALTIALGFRFRSDRTSAWHFASAVLAGGTAAVTGFILLQFAFFPGLDVENLLIQVPGKLKGVPLGRMSPLTAICLFLLGLALVRPCAKSAADRSKCGLPTSFGMAAGLIGFIVVAGYAHNTPLLYGGTVIPVALPTGVAITCLGIGAVSLYGIHGWASRLLLGPSLGARMARTFVPLVALLIVLFGVSDVGLDYMPLLQKEVWHGIFVLLLLGVGTVPVFLLSRHFEETLERAQTRQRRAESALRASEEKYRSLFESAGEAILLMDDKRVLSCNEFALELFGCPSEDLLGRAMMDFSPPTQPDGRPSKERAAEHFRLAIEGSPQRFEWVHTRANGQAFTAAVTLTRFENNGAPCVQAILRDITIEKKTREALRHERDLISRVMETSPAAIFVADKDRRVTFANSRAEELIGLSHDSMNQGVYETPDWCFTELDGTPLADSDRPTSIVLATGESVFDRRFFLSWPEERCAALSVNAAPLLDRDGTVEGCVVSVADITDILNREEDQARLEAEQRRRRELERLTLLLQGLAHEVRNPLFALNVNLEVLKKKLPPGTDGGEPLHRVSDQIRRLDELVRSLLELSHSARREEFRSVPIRDLFDTALAAAEVDEPNARRRVALETPPDHLECRCVPEKLAQALKQLLLNGLQNSPAPAPVTLLAARQADGLVIEVVDEGAGLPPRLDGRLFEPFVTSHQGRRGLGLALARHYVEAQGGTLEASNRPDGGGACFTIRIPVSGPPG